MKGQKKWRAKNNNNNIPQITDIAIRIELYFSEDPELSEKQWVIFSVIFSQMRLIQTRIKSQSASVKHASTRPPAGKPRECCMKHTTSWIRVKWGLTGEVGAGAVGAQVAAVGVGSVALVHALVGGLQLADVQQDSVSA